MVLASSAHDELSNAEIGIGVAVRRLWSEALVFVVMARDDNFGAALIERPPHGKRVAGAAMVCSRAKPGVMPVRQRADLGRGGEVRPEPLLLRRARGHGEIAVQCDDVPGTEVVTVPPRGRITSRRPKVIEVIRGPERDVVEIIVITGRWTRAG